MNFKKLLISKRSTYQVALVTIVLLLVPWFAMQFSGEVNWQLGDFITAAVLLTFFGYLYKLLTKTSMSGLKKCFIAASVLAMLIFIWAELAVGVL